MSAAIDGNGQLAAKAGQVAASATALPETCARAPVRDQAVVTLITNNEGYPAGALAVAAALEILDSQLRRIVLVTEDVSPGIQELLASASWEVVQVAAIRCNQVLGPHVTEDRYDLGAEYQQKKAKWLTTCTKFHAWNLTELSKVIFLDADTLPLQPIDSLAEHPSAFAAAPDTFPADQFNSGVMVLRPSSARFAELLAWNQEHGTAEGGDQGLLNDFFAEWFYNAWDHDECGRLPWMMNIAAASFQGARTLARMQSRDEPTIAHFVSGAGKPWLFMVLRFQGQQAQIPPAVQTLAHAWEQLYWLAKSNKVCVGLSSAEKEQSRAQLLDRL